MLHVFDLIRRTSFQSVIYKKFKLHAVSLNTQKETRSYESFFQKTFSWNALVVLYVFYIFHKNSEDYTGHAVYF